MANTLAATRLKRGMIIIQAGDLLRILDLEHKTPGNLRGFVRVKTRNLRSQTTSEQRLRSEDVVERAVLDEKQMQYLYSDGEDHYFMDTSSYEQTHLTSEALGDSVGLPQARDDHHRRVPRQPNRWASSCRRPWT